MALLTHADVSLNFGGVRALEVGDPKRDKTEETAPQAEATPCKPA